VRRLSELVQRYAVTPPPIPRRCVVDAKLPATVAEVQRVHRQIALPTPPPDARALIARLRELHRQARLHEANSRDVRQTASLLWFDAPTPLLDEPGFAAAFLDQLEHRRLRTALATLARDYLRHYEPPAGARGEALRRIADGLARQKDHLRDPWTDPAIATALFDADRGPAILAAQIVAAAPTTASGQLAHRFNIPPEDQGMGFADATFAAALRTLRERLEHGNDPEPLLDLFESWAVEGSKLRFVAHQPRLVESLLAPWLSREPGRTIRRRIEAFILDHDLDPRLHRRIWREVDPTVERLFRRWLAQRSIESFFTTIDALRLGSDAEKHMWPERKKFWLAYCRGEHVIDAQLILTPRNSRAVQHMNLRDGDEREIVFAELTHQGWMKSDHAILLMKIEGLGQTITVADWSHSGACRMWDADNPQAPSLAAAAFEPEPLRGHANKKLTHHLGWQSELAEAIERRTGIEPPPEAGA